MKTIITLLFLGISTSSCESGGGGNPATPSTITVTPTPSPITSSTSTPSSSPTPTAAPSPTPTPSLSCTTVYSYRPNVALDTTKFFPRISDNRILYQMGSASGSWIYSVNLATQTQTPIYNLGSGNFQELMGFSNDELNSRSLALKYAPTSGMWLEQLDEVTGSLSAFGPVRVAPASGSISFSFNISGGIPLALGTWAHSATVGKVGGFKLVSGNWVQFQNGSYSIPTFSTFANFSPVSFLGYGVYLNNSQVNASVSVWNVGYEAGVNVGDSFADDNLVYNYSAVSLDSFNDKLVAIGYIPAAGDRYIGVRYFNGSAWSTIALLDDADSSIEPVKVKFDSNGKIWILANRPSLKGTILARLSDSGEVEYSTLFSEASGFATSGSDLYVHSGTEAWILAHANYSVVSSDMGVVVKRCRIE